MDETEATKVIEDYGIVIEELFSGKGPLCIYDERHLPHPKSVIRNALYLELRNHPCKMWEKIEGGKKIYNSLLIGLYNLIMFQKDLGDWQIRIPDPDKEDLAPLDEKHAKSLINYIDCIRREIKETSEKERRLRIRSDPKGEVDGAITALVLLLGMAKQKLKEQL
ncbi:MAG: hypothetical protein HY278_05860 [candidate division NC10 bacterium]|nr:hypothetical protein [candidate division NC10 bacterium]